jgi:hypothetical protein
MAIPGTVPVSSSIAPLSAVDTYASHQALYGKGGLRTVETIVERNGIATPRREVGMLVYVKEGGGSLWQLGSDLTTWNPFTTGGTGVLAPATVADLRLNTQTAVEGSQAWTAGSDDPADNLPQHYRYNPEDTTTPDDGSGDVVVDTKGQRWQKIYEPQQVALAFTGQIRQLDASFIIVPFTSILTTANTDPNDGAGGQYFYDSFDSTSADNGATVLVDAVGRRWKPAHALVFNIRQWGAKGNWTNDDSTKFTNCFAAMPAGAILEIPPGTYKVGGVSLTKDIDIRLDKNAILKVPDGSKTCVFKMTAKWSGRISGGIFDGNFQGAPNTTNDFIQHCLDFQEGFNGLIENVTFRYYSNTCIYVRKLNNSVGTIQDCYFLDGQPHAGIAPNWGSSYAIGYNEQAASSQRWCEVIIQRCVFNNSNITYQPGRNPGGIIAGSLVPGNPGSIKVTVRDCCFFRVGQVNSSNEIGAIDLYQACHASLVENNVFEETEFDQIRVATDSDVIVRGNTIRSSRGMYNAGIEVQLGWRYETDPKFTGQRRVTIENNQIDLAPAWTTLATTQRSRTADVATITTASNHGLVAGDLIQICGTPTEYLSPALINDAWKIVTGTPLPTQFTYDSPGTDEATTANPYGLVLMCFKNSRIRVKIASTQRTSAQGGTVTIVTETPHGLNNGQIVSVVNTHDGSLRKGDCYINSIVNSTTFTYLHAGGDLVLTTENNAWVLEAGLASPGRMGTGIVMTAIQGDFAGEIWVRRNCVRNALYGLTSSNMDGNIIVEDNDFGTVFSDGIAAGSVAGCRVVNRNLIDAGYSGITAPGVGNSGWVVADNLIYARSQGYYGIQIKSVPTAVITGNIVTNRNGGGNITSGGVAKLVLKRNDTSGGGFGTFIEATSFQEDLLDGGFIEFGVVANPATPQTDRGRLYLRSNAGVIELVLRTSAGVFIVWSQAFQVLDLKNATDANPQTRVNKQSVSFGDGTNPLDVIWSRVGAGISRFSGGANNWDNCIAIGAGGSPSASYPLLYSIAATGAINRWFRIENTNTTFASEMGLVLTSGAGSVRISACNVAHATPAWRDRGILNATTGSAGWCIFCASNTQTVDFSLGGFQNFQVVGTNTNAGADATVTGILARNNGVMHVVKVGPNNSGPGGVGRALFIDNTV